MGNRLYKGHSSKSGKGKTKGSIFDLDEEYVKAAINTEKRTGKVTKIGRYSTESEETEEQTVDTTSFGIGRYGP